VIAKSFYHIVNSLTMFELKARDGLARVGKFKTKHGTVDTPNFLPVIGQAMINYEPERIGDMKKKFGTSVVITNAYIISQTEELKKDALKRGVHAAIGFDGSIMTDSGTFQSHVYGNVPVTNSEIVAFQRDIGADIGSVLDVFSEPDVSRHSAQAAIDETLKRAVEASEIKQSMILAGGIQGSTHPDLREDCALKMSDVQVDVNAIGGVVPLMENYRFSDLVDVVLSTKKGMTPDRLVHLYGAGHPMILALASLMGCDTFDSASYAKYANDGRMMFPDGTRKVRDLKEQICTCPTCSSLQLEELKQDSDAIADHNLHVIYNEIRLIRQAIQDGSLWELVERRCSSHPDMLSALRRLKEHSEFLERYEPASRKSSFYFTSVESLDRPVIQRYNSRLIERYRPSTRGLTVILPEASRPFSRSYRDEVEGITKTADASFVVESVLGPVPLELDEMYPLAQSLVPQVLDGETKKLMRKRTSDFIQHIGFENSIRWKGTGSKLLDGLKSKPVKRDMDILRLRAVADMQFGKGAGKALAKRNSKVVKSKKTGKIRNLLLDGEHLLSMRARDGLFTLRAEGARILHKKFRYPSMRVVVESETAEFNREGKNVFAKFVKDCDDGIRPKDEVLVVDENDELVAVARALMNREEMLSFSTGIAARVREGVPKS
jgi:7-cyano-7-deazaguanine tRNA-ribosyltransferase